MTTTKVVVIFYSLYTHTWQLAQAIVEGAHEVEGVEVELYQVPELLSDEVISKMGATQPKEAMKHIPVLTSEIRKEVIKSADAIFFGSPTRFGVMTAQMKSFFDALGGLWFENACVGKVASCFTGSGAQHGGQETTLFSMITPLLHLGFMYVGLPYSCKEQKEINEISGGTPYGSTYIANSDGSRAVSANEKACARYQGRHVAQIARELRLGRERIAKGDLTSTSSSSTSVPSTPATGSVDDKDSDDPKKKNTSSASAGTDSSKKSSDKKGDKKGDKKVTGDTKKGKKSGKDDTKKKDKKKPSKT
eukprot:TRINITY_DN2069_c0_g1_i1.p1 TRINITY_DN2069_c0_g1~~TRINITY_DN2069_c0_g1_i1.p1  ORF type:complete len:326 (-),score=68.22 TRINITY_DN2069_c0_g1_i1:249-1163(-)